MAHRVGAKAGEMKSSALTRKSERPRNKRRCGVANGKAGLLFRGDECHAYVTPALFGRGGADLNVNIYAEVEDD